MNDGIIIFVHRLTQPALVYETPKTGPEVKVNLVTMHSLAARGGDPTSMFVILQSSKVDYR